MAFDDTFRLSSHAVITNENMDILVLKANYGERRFGLPGGALEPGETIHEALERECMEEIGCRISIKYLSGVYYHSAFNSQAFIFRCEIPHGTKIKLSSEHSCFKYQPVELMSVVQQHRVRDCLAFKGCVVSAKF